MYYFKNFKNFAHTQLDLSTPLTVLIGTNGTGKSNVIEAIELLSFIVHGGMLHDISTVGSGGGRGLKIRGGLTGCPRFGQTAFSLGFSNEACSYTLEIQTQERVKINCEQLSVGEKLILETSQWQVSAQHSVFCQFPETLTSHLETLRHWGQVLQNALPIPFVFEPQPQLMRQYEEIKNEVLTKHGENLAAVLYALSHGCEEEKQTLERLLGWLKQLSDEPYHSFSFATTAFGDVIWSVTAGPESWLMNAKLLSDGTLRSLAILTALETAKPHSLIVIEEFDNSLHPSRVETLVKAIQECSQRRQLKVLVTTHNPATLNVLQHPQEQLEGVVLCAWNLAEPTSKLMRFMELPLWEEVPERGQLGDTVTRRLLEKQYLDPEFEEKRTQEALRWSEKLRALRAECSL